MDMAVTGEKEKQQQQQQQQLETRKEIMAIFDKC